jgi:hypothetical protein
MRGTQDVTPQQAAADFRASFSAAYGPERPAWQECGWQDAAARAHAQYKFLFVYLHSRHHQVLISPPNNCCSVFLCGSIEIHNLLIGHALHPGRLALPHSNRPV